MTTTREHDLVIVGQGLGICCGHPAGSVGVNVGVSRGSALGGTCLRIGCIRQKHCSNRSERFWRPQKSSPDMGSGGELKWISDQAAPERSIVTTLTRGGSLFKKNKILDTWARQDRWAGSVLVEGSGNWWNLKAKSI